MLVFKKKGARIIKKRKLGSRRGKGIVVKIDFQKEDVVGTQVVILVMRQPNGRGIVHDSKTSL